VTHVDCVLQVELFDECREVVGVGIKVVAIPRLARTAMSPPIMRDAAISARCEIEHLIFESIRGERPTMAENHGLSAAPVLEIDLRAVFGRDRVHSLFSFSAA